MKKFLPSLLAALCLFAPSVPAADGGPLLAGKIDRPLRYRPEGTDFVIENGAEFFNRSLYAGNTAFRVDGGDKPEFVLYLPGRGGNLRIGLRNAKANSGAKWLFDAENIKTLYRAGSLIYECQDPMLGKSSLRLTALPLAAPDGLIVRIDLEGYAPPPDLRLVYAYGGVSGEKGKRNGDIGAESVPVSEFFHLKPKFCNDNAISFRGDFGGVFIGDFMLRAKAATMTGRASVSSGWEVADAAKWEKLDDLLASRDQPTETPIAVGESDLPKMGQPVYMALQKADDEKADDGRNKVFLLPAALYEAAEKHRQEIAGKIVVDTPDPFINAAAAALCEAADGVWDEASGTFEHGAVAWRNSLLGWRGPYSGDALGWHDRMRRNLNRWTKRQNTQPPPESIPAPEASANLSRNENALHSEGDMSGTHYDMNLVFIDGLFRHLMWTGDLDYAREVWPVIERHLAWERRLFRREFGPDKLPLYEAYCCIWASDDLFYDGGGATHSTAYNYWHNLMAARVAKLIGKDPAPYQKEADLIAKAMQQLLWLPKEGHFAEWKDLLGAQLVHPNAGLWTFYHTVDSQAATPAEAWQMSRFVDTQIARIPLQGPGVPDEGCYTLPTTSWMPYTWSTNNVVMAEVAHTALAYWQTGRNEEAYKIFKGCLLDSMYMGLCPGNVGMCTTFDMARGESQRDFGDGVGMVSRAMVEGVFGVRPDALTGETVVRPGFPAKWDHASLRHPDFNFAFRREGQQETWTMEPKFPKPLKLRLQVAARRDHVAGVTVNGQPAPWRCLDDTVGEPRIEIECPPGARQEIVVRWEGAEPAAVEVASIVPDSTDILKVRPNFGPAQLLEITNPQEAAGDIVTGKNVFHAEGWKENLSQMNMHPTVFARLKQGDLTWQAPVPYDFHWAYDTLPAERQQADSLRFRIRNNTPQARNWHSTALNMTFNAPAMAVSEEFVLKTEELNLLPGDVFLSASTIDDPFDIYLTNWKLKAPADTRWETVELTSAFNDKVTQIFKNEYLTPRSLYCSLAMPKQGIGSWCHPTETFAVDDSGLRAASDKNGGKLVLPQGIPFATPGTAGAAKNIAFTSQWDNYPREVSIPLTGKARHAYFLVAGSTNSMQSRFDNGEIVVTYADGSTDRLPLRNPTNWWPINQDYVIDDYAFRRPEAVPPRIDLKTGAVRVLDPADFAPRRGSNLNVPGGAATVVDLPLQPGKELKSLTVRALANEVVVGLMSATLAR